MKKGFTLVELLCVIVIIAVISLITFPKVTSYINKTKESLYKTQVKDLEKSGEKWALDNLDKLDKFHINDTFITLDALKNFKYLEKDDILSPKDKEVMDGCILINFEKNKYNYKYIEMKCDTIDDLSEYSDSYVVYNSVQNGDEFDLEEVAVSNKHTPFYETVLANNEIKVLGQTGDGLYELDDEYVFRGNLVNNYVKYENKVWRILSINKSDYSMKLINTTIDQTALSTNEVTDFTKTSLQNTLAESVSNYSKITDTWNNGTISNIESKLSEIKSSISQNTITSKAGLLSLYDYAAASLDDNCYNNISNNCSNNNYLREMFKESNGNLSDIWTMSQNSDNKFYYINSSNAITVADSTNQLYRYATVIKVPISIYSTNGDIATGSDITFAYELK